MVQPQAQQEKREVPAWKLDEVKTMEAFLKGKDVVGVISLEGLPSPQLQEIKKKLRGRADIRVTKSVLVKHALENLGRKELKQLEEHINGSVALLVSNESPFVTFNFIKKNKAKVAAKPGQR